MVRILLSFPFYRWGSSDYREIKTLMVIINMSIWRRGKPETGISCYLSVLVFQGYCDKWPKTGQL